MKETVVSNPDRELTELLSTYEKPVLWKSVFQVLNTAIPFFGMWYLMYLSLEVSYWLTLALAVPTAGLLVRLFIFQHDCGHGSFFKSHTANTWLGRVIGLLSLTPYTYWRKTHAIHHARTGNLDRTEQSLGDIVTLTVREYQELSPMRKLGYRLYRNPLILFVIGPAFQFIGKHRFPWDLPWSWKKEWASVLWTNLFVALIVIGMSQAIGLGNFLMVQLPITIFASTIGVWFFYVHHQYEDTYWRKPEEWNIRQAALEGSSLYVLPRVLEWFSGNIGIHHIHHLSSKIPNYNLPQCLEDNAVFQEATKLTFWKSLRCARLKLWDEAQNKLVGYPQATT